MYFRLQTTIRGLSIEKRPIDFPYGGSHQITVSLRPPTEEEQKQGNEKEHNTMCSAVSIRDPSSRIASMLDSLANRKLPEDSRIPKEELSSAFDENGLLKMKYVVDFRVAPQPLESFARDVDRELWDYTRRTARVLRWRAEQNVVGPHNPFVNPRRGWSIDGANWIPMSFGFGVRLEVLGSLRPTEQERNEVLEIVTGGRRRSSFRLNCVCEAYISNLVGVPKTLKFA